MNDSAQQAQRTQLEVWSDVACPWCYVGRRNLAVALTDVDEAARPEVTWRAYQLDPAIPVEGADREQYFEARFGDRLPAIREGQERLVLLGEELGIEFRFDRQRTVPNTHFAHRVVRAAAERDQAEPVLDELFAGYFERGVDIGDVERVHELVTEAVLDEDLAREIIDAASNDAAIAAGVDSDIDAARQLGITGVPCFVADRRVAVPGAVPPDTLAQFLTQVASPDTDDDDPDEDSAD